MMAASGSRKSSAEPRTILRGAPTSVASSSPSRITTRNLPSGALARGFPLKSGTAHFTPLTPRTRYRSLSVSALTSSKYCVLRSITQMSASVMSLFWLRVQSMIPANIEDWCAISNEENAMAKIRPRYLARSPVSIFRATKFIEPPLSKQRSSIEHRSTKGQKNFTSFAVRADTSHKNLKRPPDEPLPFHERESRESDEEGDDAVDACPERLACFLHIGLHDLSFFHASANQVSHVVEALLAGFRFPGLARVRPVVRGGPQHESDDVVLRVLQSETDVCFHPLLEGLERVALHLVGRCQLVHVQLEKGLFAKAVEDLVLVFEVGVDRCRRVLNLISDLAHRNALVPVPHEELPGGVEDLPLQLFLFPGLTFCHSHMLSHTV